MNELELIKKLPTLEKREWSYLETIGVSQRETVIAEILRYFFDPNQKHGLGDIFIKALLKTQPKYLKHKGKKIGSGYNEIQDNYYKAIQELQNISFSKKATTCQVEVLTFNNNRIDIVINTEKLIIAIEFKINHHLDNPLNDYVNFIKCQGQINGSGKEYTENEISSYRCNGFKDKEKYFVVLTPYWKHPVGKANKNNDFVQITLASFIDNVIDLVGDFWEFKKDTHQYYIYQDFIDTIKNRGIVVNMIKKYSEIINDEKKLNLIEKLYEEGNLKQEVIDGLNKVKNDFEKKTKELLKYKKNYHLLGATEEKVQSCIVRKIDEKTEYKIRISFLGWNKELWENGVSIEEEKKYIGDYFSSIENLAEKING